MSGVAPKSVTIILSTYNGAPFLLQQLESFTRQTHENWRLLWRDDGSRDSTVAIMRGFAATQPPGRVLDFCDELGQIGIGASFLGLLKAVPPQDVVAFSDQDDVWMPRKLERGLLALARGDQALPTLYCARQILADEVLAPLCESQIFPEPAGFPQALTQNIATGCTVMLNPVAAQLVSQSVPPAVTLHDWWSYIVVTAAGGRVLIDEAPVVFYRQHKGNAVGVPLSTFRRAIAALRRGPGAFMRTLRGHIDALSAQPSLVAPQNQKILVQIKEGLNDGWGRRVRALRLPMLRRQNFSETQLFRLWFLIG